MVERYVTTVEEHLRKVVSAYQRDWDEKLPIFLLAHTARTHEDKGVTPTSMVFGRELRRPDTLFGVIPDKEMSLTDTWWTSQTGCMASTITSVNI
jgi:hypothetical protein